MHVHLVHQFNARCTLIAHAGKVKKKWTICILQALIRIGLNFDAFKLGQWIMFFAEETERHMLAVLHGPLFAVVNGPRVCVPMPWHRDTKFRMASFSYVLSGLIGTIGSGSSIALCVVRVYFMHKQNVFHIDRAQRTYLINGEKLFIIIIIIYRVFVTVYTRINGVRWRTVVVAEHCINLEADNRSPKMVKLSSETRLVCVFFFLSSLTCSFLLSLWLCVLLPVPSRM